LKTFSTITVSRAADWQKLRERKLMTVVDPMIFRTADVFLQGASSCGREPQPVWEALSSNISSLVAFFEAIMMRDQLPIFSYSHTFRESRLLDDLANYDLLVPVVVADEVYETSKRSALEALRGGGPFDATLRGSILSELKAFEYDWQPGMDLMGDGSDDDRLLNSFLLGGILFGGYAQQLSVPHGAADEQAQHFVQSKRGRMFLAAALNFPSVDFPDAELLERLVAASKKMSPRHGEANAPVAAEQLPAGPAFLPLMLREDPKSPRELLDLALTIRSTKPVEAYRAWRNRLGAELHKGREPADWRKEEQALLADVQVRLGLSEAASASIAVTVSPDVQVGLEVPVNFRRLSWLLQGLLPKNRYRKLVTQLVAEHSLYTEVTRSLRLLWFRN
jgi:hypothetical protein